MALDAQAEETRQRIYGGQVIAQALKVKLNLVSVTGQNRIPFLTEGKVDALLKRGDDVVADPARVRDP